MAFFRKHKLPKFPPGIATQFRRFSEVLPLEDIPQLKEEVSAELQSVEAEARQNRMIDIERGRQVAVACHLLLDHYEQCSAKQQAMIIGAVRYFALGEDALSEKIFASGFDDDAKVINHVLEELGFESGFVPVG